MLFLTATALAFPVDDPPECSPTPIYEVDRELYFVSTSPGPEPFSYIGHAALWIREPGRQLNHILEFGAINSSAQEPFTALLMGNLKCWWWRGTINKRVNWYRETGRRVIAQRIVLPDDAEARLFQRLYDINDNREQDYNFDWQTRNCATEIRDILDEATQGQLSAQLTDIAPQTARQEVLRYLSAHPWAWVGWAHQAGPRVDDAITRWDATFIPERLVESLMQSPVQQGGGTTAPLLGEACLINAGSHDWAAPEPPNWNARLGAVGLALAGMVAGAGRASRKGVRAIAGLSLMALGLLGGLLGSANMVLWLASDLPVYGPNENWWLTNPATFLLIPLGRAVTRGQWAGWLVKGSALLLGLASVGVVLELTPLSHQDNAGFFALLWPVIAAVAWLAWRSRLTPRS